MVLDLTRLIRNFIEEIEIKDHVLFDDEFLKTTEIRALSDVHVQGYISATTENLYNLDLEVTGEMVLPCSITLEDVNFPFSLKINEILSENEENEEKYIRIVNNSLDIAPIIWQNIVMEIPLKVISPKASRMRYEGDGWRLITDEEQNREIGLSDTEDNQQED